jgi:sugar-specific transcriptional regulator TrmB/DNA-binding CsgD family transcriptional regulator
MLKALGLSEISELVYLTLLEFPDADFQYLKGNLDLTEDEVRKALNELTRMALLYTPDSRQRTPRPVDPEVGLAALVARQQTEIARRQQEIEETKLALARLVSKHAETRPRVAEPGIEYLSGIDAIHLRLQEIAASCEKEACSFILGGAQSAEGLQTSRMLVADAIDRGVRLRTIYPDGARNRPSTIAYARWLSELGSEVRTAPSLPLQMLLVDRRIAMVPVNADGGGGSAVIVSIGGIATALYALFASVWRKSTRLGLYRDRDENDLTHQGLEALKLLGKGCTDEVIARRLGVSVRTARRVASELLTRLDARSRFQAGARAVARGWVDVNDLD